MGKGNLLQRKDKKITRFSTTRPTVMKFSLYVSVVELYEFVEQGSTGNRLSMVVNNPLKMENRLKVNSEREQDSPIEMGASNISRFKEIPFLKATRHRAHSVVSGVRVKASKKKTIPRLGIISARRHHSNP
ncbi:hypothetical protein TNCV_4834731 [Trichonephila clavipes]|nr:hypothetical protein TNCV_4834731 [Trichonephila clavipes]